jgi:hypothetical protein
VDSDLDPLFPRQAIVRWNNPVTVDNGRTILAYRAFYRLNVTGADWQLFFSGLGSVAVADNLEVGVRVFFRVIANNANGDGPPSAEVNKYLPASKPTTPTNLTTYEYADCSVIVDSRCANFTAVAWQPPASSGGVGVQLASYSYGWTPISGASDVGGATVPTTVRSVNLTTFTRGGTYKCVPPG